MPTITIEQTTDEYYIKSVFLNPKIYAEMKDDSCPSDPSSLVGMELDTDSGVFLKVLLNEVPSGCFWLTWKNKGMEAHTALLENCRGNVAIRATRKAIQWVFDNTDADFITSYAWSDTPAVSWFCRAVGMEFDGSAHWPSPRNGAAVDVINFKISRKDN